MRINSKVNLVLVFALLVASCATNQPLTTEQKILGCVGVVGLGAAIGAALAGDGSKNKGAARGAGVGAAACAVWLAFENEKDKKRIAETRIKALDSGVRQSASYVGDDGKARSVSVTPGETQSVATTSGEVVVCRSMRTELSLENQNDGLEEEWCRMSDGSYQPRYKVASTNSPESNPAS